MHAQLIQHAGRHLKIAQISRKAQLQVGLDRVQPLILQRVGLELVGQANATAFLTQVHQHALALLTNLLHSQVQLRATVAAQRPEQVTGHALAVHSDQGGAADLAHDHGHVLDTGALLLEHLHGESAVGVGILPWAIIATRGDKAEGGTLGSDDGFISFSVFSGGFSGFSRVFSQARQVFGRWGQHLSFQGEWTLSSLTRSWARLNHAFSPPGPTSRTMRASQERT